jgi:2-dehydropantoate 2-reductase
MKITIIGPGAMGCLFGAFLARAGNEITLLGRNRERAEHLRNQGILLREGEELYTATPTVTHLPQEAAGGELVIVMVKTPQTAAVAKIIPQLLGPDTSVLTLQNGLGAAIELAEVIGAERILTGVTAQGATLIAPGEVRYGGAGDTLIGPHCSNGAPRLDVVDLFNGAGLSAQWREAIADSVWKKLAANCGINAITALANIKNALVQTSSEAAALASEAVRETAKVALAEGTDLGDPEGLALWVLSVARATGKNRSSMGQFFNDTATTEIDYINGAVARLGKKHNIQTPVNLTLTRLIKTLETGYQPH